MTQNQSCIIPWEVIPKDNSASPNKKYLSTHNSGHRVKLSAYDKNALNALYPNSSYLSTLTRSLKMKAERRFRKRRSESRNWRKRIGRTGGRRKQLFTNNINNYNYL
ncbi:uncharacterized protein OCT59_009449 [Rhizophagus irregularis]|uniref:uncharacterized protein n=1 Tax=Rhizophagus irregularis TaxID=588596 RepID=UPI00332AAFBA|nr:hypothetical protein OCT59_009449 [Rhizophagus irregularis]